MKRIFTLIALFLFSSIGVFAQSSIQTLSPTITESKPIGGHTAVWDAPTPAKIAFADGLYISTNPTLDGTGQYSEFLRCSGFGFTIPTNATITAVTVLLRRKARGTANSDISDQYVSLVYNDAMVGFDDANTSDIWGSSDANRFYDGSNGGSGPLWGYAWTPAEINDPSFGVQISVQVLAGIPGGIDYFADVNRLQIAVEFLVPTPIILTNFDVKNVNNKVDISFVTESEYKVKTLFIERSSDGKNYTDLFAIEPKGNVNTTQNYHLTDAAPLLGTNYYRLKELDIDGKWHYYETRVIKMNNANAKFQAYQNNGKVVVNFNNQPGNYTLSLIDMNGSIVATQNFRVDKQAVQVFMNPPVKRTGIYLVNLKGGDNFNESLKLFIQR